MLQNTDTVRPDNTLTRYFEGEANARGFIIDMFGRVRTRFCVRMKGYWAEKDFILDETFTYDDGKVEERLWRVRFSARGRFTATAAALARPARGRIVGDEVWMDYAYPVPVLGMTMKLRFDDRMYPLGNGALFERARLRKFGVTLAELILVFRK
jgi:hypothetical protein